ncbi:PIR Superfamily Protein, partial [Plasmodium malariae]
YPHLNIWSKYSTHSLNGLYNNYQSICNEINLYSEGRLENDVCITIFGLLENYIDDSGTSDTIQGVYNDFMQYSNVEKLSDSINSINIRDFMFYFKNIVRNKVFKNITMIKDVYENNDMLSGIIKLFYFNENVSEIKNILSNRNDQKYANVCKFVNECLDTYREFLNYLCPADMYDRFTDSTICNELQVFFENYDNHLYLPLRRNNNIASLREYPDLARVRCDLSESLYKWYPAFKIFTNIKRDLTPFGKTFISFLSIFGIFLTFYILYMFTPLGSEVNARRQKFKRSWRNIQSAFKDQVKSITNNMCKQNSNNSNNSFNLGYHTSQFKP